MTKRIPRARGAAYVEVLVIVGIVVTLGLAAVVALGNGAKSKADQQAQCIVSFACNSGNGAQTTGTLAAMVGTGAQSGVVATTAKPSGLVVSPPSKRDLANAASSALADAEDRLAALERTGNASDAQIDQARAALDAANDAYDAAGQAVLDEAYGAHYGTLARNWIDFKNTPSFLGGLAVGTVQGVASMPGDLASAAGAAYNWITGNSPPADPAADRAAHLQERREYLDHELLRISPDGGADANYQDGTYDGKVVLAGVVVGEGVGLAVKGGAAAVAAARTARTAETAVDVVTAAQRGERLGEGTFSTAYKHGDVVQKVIKSEIAVQTGTRALTQADRTMLAQEMTEFTNEAGAAVGGKIVPPITNLGEGVLQQGYVEGKTISELLQSGDMAAYDRAVEAKNVAMSNAAKGIGLDGPYSSGTLENGWTVHIDDNLANFRFAPDGTLTSWFDPIAIFPP